MLYVFLAAEGSALLRQALGHAEQGIEGALEVVGEDRGKFIFLLIENSERGLTFSQFLFRAVPFIDPAQLHADLDQAVEQGLIRLDGV